MRTRTQLLHLVAEVAVQNLPASRLSLRDRADFFDGLTLLLEPTAGEWARYAATCIRESSRAEAELLATLKSVKGALSR